MNYKIAAVTNNKKDLSKHFGKSKFFAIYHIDYDKIVEIEFRELPEHTKSTSKSPIQLGIIDKSISPSLDHHAKLVEMIRDCKAVISGGMGQGMNDRLKKANIETYLTKIKNIDEAVQAYIAGTLINDNELIH